MNSHILIVDDEASIREILRLALIRRGYRVTDVTSAAQARRVAREDPPKLIISDLQLEDSDGLEMIAHLKIELPEVPVLLLTGVHFDAQVVHETLAGKISSYLHKTAPLARILAEVERLLRV
jgi:DNA-binding NtrC family response regulator